MVENKNEEEARKAIRLARITRRIDRLLSFIYVLIAFYIVFTIREIFIIVTIVIFSVLLLCLPHILLTRKIDKLLGIQEGYFKAVKDRIRKFLPELIFLMDIVTTKPISSEGAESIFEMFIQKSREELRMKYERFKVNMPPAKQRAVDEVVEIFLDEGWKEYIEMREALEPVKKIMILCSVISLALLILVIILHIHFTPLIIFILIICMFAILFGSKFVKSFKLLELFKNIKMKVRWKPLTSVKWEVIKMLLIGFASIFLYTMFVRTTEPLFSIIFFFIFFLFFIRFAIPEIAKIMIIGYFFFKRKISKYFYS